MNYHYSNEQMKLIIIIYIVPERILLLLINLWYYFFWLAKINYHWFPTYNKAKICLRRWWNVSFNFTHLVLKALIHPITTALKWSGFFTRITKILVVFPRFKMIALHFHFALADAHPWLFKPVNLFEQKICHW